MSADPRARKVLVIGGGPSGLVAYRELERRGFEVECFERTHSIGGVFGEAGNKSYYTLLNVSNFFVSFSDFPPTDGAIRRWTWNEYLAYLRRYAAAHGLVVQCRKAVERIDRRDGRYAVEIRDLDSGERLRRTVDAVVVCAGLHHKPRPLPFAVRDLPVYSVAELTPEVIASMRDRNVLLFGLGESTADVLKVLPPTRKIFVVTRRKRCFGPNIIKAYPPDLSLSRVWQALPSSIHRLVDRCLAHFAPDRVERRIARLSCASKLTCMSDFLIKNSGFAEALLDRDVVVKRGIEGVAATQVTFVDGERAAVDFVVNCTGFDLELPALRLDGEGVGPIRFRQLYKHLFLPGIGPTLSFIGYAKPTTGNIPATAEMQARYLAMLLNREIEPPPDVDRVIDEDARYYRENLSVDNEHLVHYGRYLDSLAEAIGCRPKALALLRRADPRLLWHCFMGSQNGFQYRLLGPDSDFARSRDIIVGLPVTTRTIYLPFFLAVEALRSLASLGAKAAPRRSAHRG